MLSLLSQPVSQWRDDQTVSTTRVLVAVVKLDVGNLNQTSVDVFDKVKPRLLQPLEVGR